MKINKIQYKTLYVVRCAYDNGRYRIVIYTGIGSAEYLHRDGTIRHFSKKYKSSREAIGILKKFIPNLKKIKHHRFQSNVDDIAFEPK